MSGGRGGSFTCAPLKLAGSQWQKRQSCVCVDCVCGATGRMRNEKEIIQLLLSTWLERCAALTPPPLLFAYRSFPLYGFMCF